MELRAGRRNIVIAIKATKVILIKIKKLLAFDSEKLRTDGRSVLTIPGISLLKKKAMIQMTSVMKNI